MTDKEAWNRCRYRPHATGGHYESYFLRANHPARPLAFWIRYTIFSPKGRPQDAVGEVWAIHFDNENGRIAAAKEVYPLKECRIGESALGLTFGSAVLGAAKLAGGARSPSHTLQWELEYAGRQPPLLLLPAALYRGGFPKAKSLVAAPNAIFDGELRVDGEPIPIDGWQGSQNHNWGSRHTDSYAWGQVAGFEDAPDAFLECATARLRMGPLWTPAMSPIVFRDGDREYALNALGQSLLTRGDFDFFDWHIDAGSADIRLSARIHAPRSAFVGLRYANPPGGVKTCLNTKLAACELTLERAGHPARVYRTRHRAAFEILTDRHDHGVRVVA
ncbi:MAG TPA: hypothetical protein VEC06_09030 [Paucimonas sp.]|nr:hypothetical protein [Paucimonas sp.]